MREWIGPNQRGQIRLEEHIDERIGQRSRSARRDTEGVADETRGAIGGDHKGGTDGRGFATLPMRDLRRHTRAILRERHEFAVEMRDHATTLRVFP